jgi:hypothetical protein
LSIRSRRNRLVALVAAIALIVAASVYTAHGFGERVHDEVHCVLCAHFSGTGGSPSPAVVVGKPVLVMWVPLAQPQSILPVRRKASTHLPRAPPLLLEVS